MLLFVMILAVFILGSLPRSYYAFNIEGERFSVEKEEVINSVYICTDGKEYFVLDGISCNLLFSSFNCAEAVNKALSLCGNGASITFKAGSYPCSFKIDKKLFISGEGKSSTVIYGTIIFESKLVNGTPCSHHSVLKDLRLDGQNRFRVGIKYESPIPSVPLITVRDVDIENYLEKGICFINASDCIFENVVVANCPTAIYYTTNHNFGRIINCELLNYRVQGLYTDAQIYLSGTVFSAIKTPPTIADLVLDNAFGTIIGCWFENAAENPPAPCIDMPNTCYRPLIITGCFFANKGGPIIIVRNEFGVSITGCFFTQQDNPERGCCLQLLEGTVYWSGNKLDPAFQDTLELFEIVGGTIIS